MELGQAIRNLKLGDRRALEFIYNDTKRAVFSVAKGVLGADATAEDVMQETYVKVCEKINTYKEGTSPLAWICRIAKNAALDEYRRRKNSVTLIENIPLEGDFAGDANTRVDAQNLIKKAQKVLSRNEFLLIYMYTVGEMSHREIANVLEKPYATVRWGYSAAVKKLQKALEQYE